MNWRMTARFGGVMLMATCGVAVLSGRVEAQRDGIERYLAGIKINSSSKTVLALYGNPNDIQIGDSPLRSPGGGGAAGGATGGGDMPMGGSLGGGGALGAPPGMGSSGGGGKMGAMMGGGGAPMGSSGMMGGMGGGGMRGPGGMPGGMMGSSGMMGGGGMRGPGGGGTPFGGGSPFGNRGPGGMPGGMMGSSGMMGGGGMRGPGGMPGGMMGGGGKMGDDGPGGATLGGGMIGGGGGAMLGGGGQVGGGMSNFGQTTSSGTYQDEVTWTYNRKIKDAKGQLQAVAYDFLIAPDGKVSQIRVVGYVPRTRNDRTSRGITLGSTYKDLVRLYGTPKRVFRQGQMLVCGYPERHVEFQLMSTSTINRQVDQYTDVYKVVSIQIDAVE